MAKSNPNEVNGPNEYYGDKVGLTKGEAVPMAPGGNTVDRGQIPKTLNVLDSNPSKAKPLGQSSTTGF